MVHESGEVGIKVQCSESKLLRPFSQEAHTQNTALQTIQDNSARAHTHTQLDAPLDGLAPKKWNIGSKLLTCCANSPPTE